MVKGSAANTENPIYDYGDGSVLIRGTEYYHPEIQSLDHIGQETWGPAAGERNPSTPSCVCGWDDTTILVNTSLGEFYFCHSRHGNDYDAFAKKYLEDMRIFLEYKKQLKLEL